MPLTLTLLHTSFVCIKLFNVLLKEGASDSLTAYCVNINLLDKAST